MTTRTLRVEPIHDPDDGSEYSILDQDGNELAVVSGGKELAHKMAASELMHDALTMVRDADNDCRRDDLPTIPMPARGVIDRAIDVAEGRA